MNIKNLFDIHESREGRLFTIQDANKLFCRSTLANENSNFRTEQMSFLPLEVNSVQIKSIVKIHICIYLSIDLCINQLTFIAIRHCRI